MKNFFILILIVFLSLDEVFASVEIISLLPNPVGDDTLGEYIELRNTSCTLIDISHYSLVDASGKSYFIPESTVLLSHERRRFPFSETKISLNNTGEETITLKDTEGKILDSFSYSGTQREDVILSLSIQDEFCSIPTDSSGSLFFTGGVLSSTGSTPNTGSEIGTGSLNEMLQSSSGMSFTGDLYNNGIPLPFSGTTFSDSGVLEYSSGITLSGNIEDLKMENRDAGVDSGSILTQPEKLLPQWLYYLDTDNNQKIDTLEIVYNSLLSGSISFSQISLSSKSGGLSNAKIDTATGSILSGYLSGNILILGLKEGDIEKRSLNITNTSLSDLRLKSSGNLGFESIDGKKPEDFYLTTSFENYRKVSRKGEIGIEITQTGEYLAVETGSAEATALVFPEIVPTLQSPTNAQFFSGSFLCSVADCRINITLEPLFQSGISQKNYSCSFSTGTILVLDSDCNPNTYNFSSSGIISLEIISRIDGTRHIREIPVLYFPQVPSKFEENTDKKDTILDVGKPVAILTIDGKWKEYYEQLGDYEMNCYAFTCSLNFSAEKSYDREGSSIRFLWIYGRNDIKTTKDPGAIRYDVGDHRLILRVIDESGNYDEIIYITHVLGPKPRQSAQKSEKKSANIPLKKITREVQAVKKKYKKIKMEFFTEPLLILQGKTGKKIQEGKYTCSLKTAKTCSINFTLSGALASFEYGWYLDGVSVYRGKNPRAWKLKPGNHHLLLATYSKGSTIAISHQNFTISVYITPKKSKKTVKAPKKVKKLPKKSLSVIPIAVANSQDRGEVPSSDAPLALFILILGIGSGYLLKSRKKGNHSS